MAIYAKSDQTNISDSSLRRILGEALKFWVIGHTDAAPFLDTLFLNICIVCLYSYLISAIYFDLFLITFPFTIKAALVVNFDAVWIRK